jgi:hypothetical protein
MGKNKMKTTIQSVYENLWEKDPVLAAALRRVSILQGDLKKAEAQLRALVEARFVCGRTPERPKSSHHPKQQSSTLMKTTIQTTKEIPIKQWFMEQAQSCGLSERCFINHYYQGKVKKPELRRVNKRVVLVKVAA